MPTPPSRRFRPAPKPPEPRADLRPSPAPFLPVEGLCGACGTAFAWAGSAAGLCYWCDPAGKAARPRV